uniref:Uncharacterized protein n=1 Tax=Rhizophora mucronata TaxID=61149 RepID=A0A2P2QSX2_RHIMU
MGCLTRICGISCHTKCYQMQTMEVFSTFPWMLYVSPLFYANAK